MKIQHFSLLDSFKLWENYETCFKSIFILKILC